MKQAFRQQLIGLAAWICLGFLSPNIEGASFLRNNNTLKVTYSMSNQEAEGFRNEFASNYLDDVIQNRNKVAAESLIGLAEEGLPIEFFDSQSEKLRKEDIIHCFLSAEPTVLEVACYLARNRSIEDESNDQLAPLLFHPKRRDIIKKVVKKLNKNEVFATSSFWKMVDYFMNPPIKTEKKAFAPVFCSSVTRAWLMYLPMNKEAVEHAQKVIGLPSSKATKHPKKASDTQEVQKELPKIVWSREKYLQWLSSEEKVYQDMAVHLFSSLDTSKRFFLLQQMLSSTLNAEDDTDALLSTAQRFVLFQKLGIVEGWLKKISPDVEVFYSWVQDDRRCVQEMGKALMHQLSEKKLFLFLIKDKQANIVDGKKLNRLIERNFFTQKYMEMASDLLHQLVFDYLDALFYNIDSLSQAIKEKSNSQEAHTSEEFSKHKKGALQKLKEKAIGSMKKLKDAYVFKFWIGEKLKSLILLSSYEEVKAYTVILNDFASRGILPFEEENHPLNQLDLYVGYFKVGYQSQKATERNEVNTSIYDTLALFLLKYKKQYHKSKKEEAMFKDFLNKLFKAIQETNKYTFLKKLYEKEDEMRQELETKEYSLLLSLAEKSRESTVRLITFLKGKSSLFVKRNYASFYTFVCNHYSSIPVSSREDIIALCKQHMLSIPKVLIEKKYVKRRYIACFCFIGLLFWMVLRNQKKRRQF